jgi:hypothetical protein
MRVFAAVLLSMSVAAMPLLARNAGETSKEETPAAASSASPLPEKPRPEAAAAEKTAAVKPEASPIESEMQDLRSLIEEQRAELEAQRAALKAQQLKMEALEEKLRVTAPSEPVSAPVPATASPAISAGASVLSAAAATPVTPAATATAAMPAQQGTQESPLYFKIGAAEFYPLGFMDLMGVFRTTQLGGIGTSFGSIVFNNAIANPSGRLTEFRFSAQNSRIGLRTHAKFGEGDVTGYLETDFLGYSVPNLNDTSNSNTLRTRLYWVDYRRGKIEVLGGQSWSFLTPNRNGLGALPGDLFYSQDVDTNYQLGLTWARQSSFRVIVHPSANVAAGVSFENAQQTLPSSVVTPVFNNTGYNSQFDTNSGNTSNANAVNNPNVANKHPDVIPKIAFDFKPGGHQVHFDFAGLFRTFSAVNLVQNTGSTVTAANTLKSTIHGGGVEGGANVEILKNFRIIGTAFYSYGGGRYIASTAGPDVIVRGDGSLSGVKSGSGIGGFEWTPNPKMVIYGYYSGAYFGRNDNAVLTTVNTPATGTPTGVCTITTNYGYGFPAGSSQLTSGTGTCPAAPGASASSANRYLFEPTFGLHYMFWRNPSYGDLRLMTQVSYVSRAPWFVANNAPGTAHLAMVYVDLRYDIP